MPPNAAPAAYAAAAAAAGAPVTGGGAADALLLVSSYTDYGTLAHTPRGVPEAASGVAAYEVRQARQRGASHQIRQTTRKQGYGKAGRAGRAPPPQRFLSEAAAARSALGSGCATARPGARGGGLPGGAAGARPGRPRGAGALSLPALL